MVIDFRGIVDPMARKGPRPGKTTPKATISLLLPVDLLEQINNQVNELGISRAKWFELVVSDVLVAGVRSGYEGYEDSPVRTQRAGRQLLWGTELAG